MSRSPIRRSGGKGERLFFHFSGHGITSRVGFSDENALVPADFSDLFTTRSLSLRSILEFFQSTQFRRIRAQLRRAYGEYASGQGDLIYVSDLVVDLTRGQVRRANGGLHYRTSGEFAAALDWLSTGYHLPA